MSNYSVLFTIVLFISFNIGCSDFIELNSPTAVSADVFYQNESEFEKAVNGVYNRLRVYYNSFWVIGELPSDNTQVNGYTLGASDMDYLTWVPSTTQIQSFWNNSYSVISRANYVLEKLDQVDIVQAKKEKFQAECLFIRSLMYFNLIQGFGDVPLVLEVIESENKAYDYVRNKKEEILNKLKNDLNTAIKSLPSNVDSGENGKITKGAALALLGKIYLTNKEYNDAIKQLENIIALDKYRLLHDYNEVFAVNNQNNDEIIFSIQYYGGKGYGEGSNFSISFAPFGSGDKITSGGQPASANAGTYDLYIQFEPNDLRRNISIDLWDASDSLFYTRKFLDRPVTSNEAKNHWPVFRYSDVLLMLSEAYNEIGNKQESLKYINIVRNRAGLSDVSRSIDNNELKNIILNERRIELCFEGHRWFDLIRTETMIETMTEYRNKYENEPNWKGYNVHFYEVDETKKLFPIPFKEISLNSELKQNPGY